MPLQRLDGQNTHLHVDEVRLRPDGLLLQCSYTFGVVDARDAGRLRYLAQNLTHTIPGDRRRPGCVHLAWDGDVVYTTHRGNIRNPAFLTARDITDREQPVQLPALQEPGVSYDARVYDVSVPSTPRFVGAVRLTRDLNVPEDDRPAATSRILGIAARDQDVFIGNWHQLYSYRLYPDRVAPSLRLPEAAGMVDFGPVAAGGTRTLSLPVTNQGTAPLTVFSANVAGEAFTVEPAQAEIAPGATARLLATARTS